MWQISLQFLWIYAKRLYVMALEYAWNNGYLFMMPDGNIVVNIWWWPF